jgi:hypothetical protein
MSKVRELVEVVLPTQVYYGAREVILTELSGFYAIYPGKYLVVPLGDAQWDAEGADNPEELNASLPNIVASGPMQSLFVSKDE